MSYEAPQLSDEAIQVALQTGLLGDQLRHVTVEQLKSATPGLLIQLFMSVLQKLGVNTDEFGRHPLADTENVEMTPSYTIKLFRLPLAINSCVPSIKMTSGDLMFPKWKTTRGLMSVVVNYLRLVENFGHVWNEVAQDFDDSEKKLHVLRQKMLELQKKEEDFISHMENHKDLYEKQKLELKGLNEKWDQVLVMQQQKVKEKEAAKQCFMEASKKHERAQQDLENLKRHKVELEGCIISNPQQYGEENQALVKKLEALNAEADQLSHDRQFTEEKLETNSKMIEIMQYDLEQINIVQKMADTAKDTEDQLRKLKGEIKVTTMERKVLNERKKALNEQLVSSREQLQRLRLRSNQEIAAIEQELVKLKSENEILSSKVVSKSDRMEKLHQNLLEERKRREEMESNYAVAVEKLKSTQSSVIDEFIKTKEQTIQLLQRPYEPLKEHL
ncbi:uncharacterized protein LOC100186809 [Ciona intestinalis]